jgi:cellulose synthase/poly-beta-1,6-N-acetylglucosamine synthase-like glycosyltransferase
MISGLVFWFSVGLVVYVYAGYPLIVTGLARLRSPTTWAGTDRPKVTLIIAAYNEAPEIGPKLEAALTLDYPEELLQIIVAADGSNDETADIARGFANRGVEVFHQPERRGKMAAISRAAQWATGEILVFSDANNRFDRDAIEALVAPFSSQQIGMTIGYKTVTGPDGLGHSEGAYWKYEAHIRRMETRLGCTVGVNGEIFAIRRDLFRAAPPGTINDDQWMSHQLIMEGHDVVFCPGAISRELVSQSATDERERRTRMVAGQYQIFGNPWKSLPWRRPMHTWMFISHKLLRPAVPFGMVGAGFGALGALVSADPSGGAVALAGWWAVFAVVAQAGFYLMAAIGGRIRGLAKVTYVPRFLVDSNLAALRGLWRHLTGSQTALWDRVERATQ